MVQHKAQLKKQQKQKRGVDFKKIKRKIGRKLPPPKNTTNTEVKSKAIILPEQSLASEKGGLAVSKKGLTLKELLQQTCHHNAKVRRDALIGIRDILVKHPTELKTHRLSVIEKLRERMIDEDKIVRETLFQLLKSVIFPACKEDNQGTFVSLMMAYVFNAMTHLSIDVRLMAFKFFDLLVQSYPIVFSMYAEKIIQHYKEILQKNQFNLHDKGKLKSVLAGLAYCLSLLPSESDNNSSTDGNAHVLHAFESQVHEDRSGFSVTAKELKGILPILVSGIQDFMPMPSLEAHSYDCVFSILKSMHLVVKFFAHGSSNRRDLDMLQILLKKLFVAFPLTPTHGSSDKDDNRYFVLNVMVCEIFFCLCDWSAPVSPFLDKFLVFVIDALSHKVLHPGKPFFLKHSLPLIPFIPKLVTVVDHTWKSHILEAFTEVFNNCDPESAMKLVCLSAVEEMLFPNRGDTVISEFEIKWVKEIPLLLTRLGDKNLTASKAVLRVLLHLGQSGVPLSREVENSFKEFLFSENEYGPFVKVSGEIQELAICCLYYFSLLDQPLLEAIAACCLCQDLQPILLFRLLEVVSCAYTAGHVQIADYISFLITLLMSENRISSSSNSKSVSSAVCSCLAQIGDAHLVLKMVEGPLIHQIDSCQADNGRLEKTCALLRVLMTLDSKPTKLSQDSVSKLVNVLPEYLMDVVSSLGEEKCGSSNRRYYMLPCYLLFSRSEKILQHVLNVMASLICINSSRIIAVFSVVVLFHEDARVWQILLGYKKEVDSILQNTLDLTSSQELKIQEKHKIQSAYDQLKTLTDR